MDPTALGTLALLALVDSTSFGTLLIPLWLMLVPGRVRPGRVLFFLGVVGAFYLGLGLVLMGAAGALRPQLQALTEGVVAARIQLVVGVLLVLVSLVCGRGAGVGQRAQRWRERAVGSESRGGGGALALLALSAAALEAATMVPYLAALGIITRSDPGAGATVAVLSAYCLVMLAPALVLLALRLGVGARVHRPLTRLADWMARHSGETVAWVVGILGFLVARDAVLRSPDLFSRMPW